MFFILDVTSSIKRNYLRLLYSKGKSPSQQRSMIYYSYLSNFQMVREGVGFDAWEAVIKSAIGVFPMFFMSSNSHGGQSLSITY